jgi:hypothetical protein
MISQTFSPVSAQRWQDIKAAIQQKTGVLITADAGSSSYEGVKFSWEFSGESVEVTILSVTFGDDIIGQTETTVMKEFAGWVDGVQ